MVFVLFDDGVCVLIVEVVWCVKLLVLWLLEEL